jgi:hypothetical protein
MMRLLSLGPEFAEAQLLRRMQARLWVAYLSHQPHHLIKSPIERLDDRIVKYLTMTLGIPGAANYLEEVAALNNLYPSGLRRVFPTLSQRHLFNAS